MDSIDNHERNAVFHKLLLSQKMHHPVLKAMVAIIGQTIDFQAMFLM